MESTHHDTGGLALARRVARWRARAGAVLDARPRIRDALLNSGWLVGARVVRLGVNLGVGAWVARSLGAAQFGTLSFAIALTSLFGILATLGLNRIVVRELVAAPEDRPSILGTALVMRIAAGFVTYAAVFAMALELSPGDPRAPWLVAIVGAGIVFEALDVFDLAFQARVESRYSVLAKTSACISIACVKIVLLLAGAPLEAFAWAVLGEVAIGALVLLWIQPDALRSLRFETRRAVALLSESWPEILSGFATLAMIRLDQIMLGQLVGSEAVGLYSAASRISEATWFVGGAIVTSTFPALVALRGEDDTRYHRRLQQLFSWLVAISGATALVLGAVAPWLIDLLFGAAYAPSAGVLVLHAWTGVAVSLGVASGSWIMAEKRVRLAFYRTCVGALCNFSLNLVLIPSYGIEGAAIATGVSLAVAFYGFDAFSPPMRRIFRMKTRALLLRDLGRH